MAVPNNPEQQAAQLQPQEQVAILPTASYGYPPQDQIASSEYPPGASGYLGGCPPQAQSHLVQGALLAQDYKAEQFATAFNYPPQLAGAAVVVVSQPTAEAAATTVHLATPEKDYSGLAISALRCHCARCFAEGPSSASLFLPSS